jgi:hypothetical protein
LLYLLDGYLWDFKKQKLMKTLLNGKIITLTKCLLIYETVLSCGSEKCECTTLKKARMNEIKSYFKNYESDFYLSQNTILYEYQNLLLKKMGTISKNDSIQIKEIGLNCDEDEMIIWLEKSKNQWVIFECLKVRKGDKY